ncbi:hypothetical protein BGX27_007554 [Mortierella sp. AM989]|nr:hypothetical protein BGX27_007554 [Mortierella sp. AM989]
MSLPQRNPLDIPEIIVMVGQYIKQRQEGDLWGPSKIHTRELFTLTLVSKTWRSALLPILWRAYDGSKLIQASNEVITKYSPHFRTITNFKHSGSFDFARVTRIEIGANNTLEASLLQQFLPRLTTICWQGSIHMWGPAMNLDLSIPKCDAESHGTNKDIDSPIRLSTLPTNISSLELHQCSIPDIAPFIELLSRFSNLSSLSLSVSTPWELPPSIDGAYLPMTHLLPTVKRLHLDFTKHRSNGSLCAIPHFPNIEELKVTGSWLDPRKKYCRRMPIHLFCPSIRDVDIDAIGYPDSFNIRNGPDGHDLAMLIYDLTGASGTLRSLRVKLSRFNFGASVAISMHAKSLESLDLDIENTPKTYGFGPSHLELECHMFRSVGSILKNCYRLKHFSLRHEYYRALGCGDYANLLFSEVWACSNNLQELEILLPPSQNALDRVLDDFEMDYEDGRGACVWRAESNIRLETELEKQIFGILKHMPQLWRLKLNKVRIFKIKKYE